MATVVESGPIHDTEPVKYHAEEDEDYAEEEDEEEVVTASALFAKTVDGRYILLHSSILC